MTEEKEESLLSHLLELRTRLMWASAAVAVAFLCLVPWSKTLYHFIAKPLLAALPQGGQMIATDVIGVFLVPMKVTLMLAFLIALPVVLYQAWAFVAPGLYAREKRLVLPLLVASVVLFFTGMAFAYFLVFPMIFRFMSAIAPEGVAWMTDIDKYLSFVLATFMAFGLTFEVPIIVILLVKAGIVEVAALKKARPYVIVGAFVIAAFLTPPDVISQFCLAIPMCLLYEAGMWIASWLNQKPDEEALLDDEALAAALLQAQDLEKRKRLGLSAPPAPK
ncbi:MAG: twin-arginine translocase subunit TatC [Zoogloeaceae bacterium]|jgi:sec-independent protein translocase protein TatC|nr:twin-arginine translocase subunit TatC [Zoogloeaceae bacterium]